MEKKLEKWIQHYSSSQKILLVGEGDFSFSACLARHFSSAVNMVATSFDPPGMVRSKHWSSETHLEELKRLGCLVLYEVDVTEMNKHPALIHMQFDVIVFNFPHAGHFPCLCERNLQLIKMHRQLCKAFFKSAREMLTCGGEVHVTHRDDYPYRTWKLEKLAKGVGLYLKERVEFQKKDYPGYHNKRGGDIKSNKTFPVKDCYTFKFSPNINPKKEVEGGINVIVDDYEEDGSASCGSLSDEINQDGILPVMIMNRVHLN